jgi:hypothetical protein
VKIPFFGKSSRLPTGIREEDYEEASRLLDKTREVSSFPFRQNPNTVAKKYPDEYARVMDVTGTRRGSMAIALLYAARSAQYDVKDYFQQLAGRLVATPGTLPVELFPLFVQMWTECSPYGSRARVLTLTENLVEEHGLLPIIEQTLRGMLRQQEQYLQYTQNANERREYLRIQAILDPQSAEGFKLPEPWQEPFKETVWADVLDHALTATSAKMSDKWAKAARPLVAEAGEDRFLDTFAQAVDKVHAMKAAVDALHADMLRGLAWMAGLTGSPRAAASLGRLVIASAHKIEGVGPRSQKGFTGAIGALERMGTFEALSALSNARNRIKAASLVATLAGALHRAATAQGMPMADLEELVVPTYGLDLPGVRIDTLGNVEARIEIAGTTDVALRWFRDGKELKSAPAGVKNGFADELKDLKATVKEMEATLAAQRARIEGMMLSGRTLPYGAWRERYIDHPLLANISRRLIWRFANPEGERLGIAPEGTPIDETGNPLPDLGDGTTVRLWHPIHAGVTHIEVWREFLIDREIRQPFKQAYREIYLLTAAEERTRIYSNRFAAHVLRQHQLNALARERGWRYSLQGFFDSSDHPTLDLSAWGLWAEYFVEVADMGNVPEAERMTPSGIALYVVTDQVRFNASASDDAVPLESVPPVVFSEVMRDVDLFVGVTSVGNDPSWEDQGNRTSYGGYWREVSFGDLSATAETRKAVLNRLLPRLAIGKVARIDGKFLVVKGKLRTYKIHLGSGNILMEPNDQYLCIVPGSGKAEGREKVYLPFEGDGVLAIILSKAMMLANDDKITDVTITRQL